MIPAPGQKNFLKGKAASVGCLPLFHIPFSLHQIIDTLSNIFEKNTLPLLNTLLRTLTACNTRCVGFSHAEQFRDTVIEYGHVQPLAHCLCCAPSPATLLLGNCYHGTISGPAQPLVSTAVGSSPKQATLNELLLLNHWLAP